MKKRFTLIELLAVIIILAIIALIATPMVLNVIEDVKKTAPTPVVKDPSPTSIVYYEFGTPTTSSTTDYTTLGHDVFTMLSSNGKKGICINEGGLFCIRTNDYENSKELLREHFGKSRCNDHGSYFDCYSGDFFCTIHPDDRMSCDDYSSSIYESCSINSDGTLDCTAGSI